MFFFSTHFCFSWSNYLSKFLIHFSCVYGYIPLKFSKKYVKCLHNFFPGCITANLSVPLDFFSETPRSRVFHPLVKIWTVGLFFLHLLFFLSYLGASVPWISCLHFSSVCFLLLKGISSLASYEEVHGR